MSVSEGEGLSGMEFAQALVDKVGGLDKFGPETPSTPADTAPEAPVVEETTPEPAGAEETVEEIDLPEGATVDAHGNVHGPDGKFIGKIKPEEGEEAGEAAEQEEPAEASDEFIELEIDDPDVQEFLAKYNGDVAEALKAATNAQKMIGRQGQELGELRKVQQELAELRQQLTQPQQPALPPLPVGYIDSVIEDNPERAAHLAVQYGDADALVRAVQAWAADPDESFRATAFWVNLQQEFLLDQLKTGQQQEQVAPPPQDEVGVEVAKVVQRHPDLEQYLPQIGELAQQRPLLRDALEHGSPQQRAQALETLYELAVSRHSADTSREAVKKVLVRAKQDSDRAKADAAVVSAGGRSAATSDQPSGADVFRQAFRQRLGLDVEVD